jgi:hypothetical protein
MTLCVLCFAVLHAVICKPLIPIADQLKLLAAQQPSRTAAPVSTSIAGYATDLCVLQTVSADLKPELLYPATADPPSLGAVVGWPDSLAGKQALLKAAESSNSPEPASPIHDQKWLNEVVAKTLALRRMFCDNTVMHVAAGETFAAAAHSLRFLGSTSAGNAGSPVLTATPGTNQINGFIGVRMYHVTSPLYFGCCLPSPHTRQQPTAFCVCIEGVALRVWRMWRWPRLTRTSSRCMRVSCYRASSRSLPLPTRRCGRGPPASSAK